MALFENAAEWREAAKGDGEETKASKDPEVQPETSRVTIDEDFIAGIPAELRSLFETILKTIDEDRNAIEQGKTSDLRSKDAFINFIKAVKPKENAEINHQVSPEIQKIIYYLQQEVDQVHILAFTAEKFGVDRDETMTSKTPDPIEITKEKFITDLQKHFLDPHS